MRKNDDNKRLIMDALKAMGAMNVTVEYSGSGDSGQIDHCVIDYDSKNDVRVEVYVHEERFQEGIGWVKGPSVKKNRKLTEVIIDYCDSILDHEHGGCFNNDGADGRFEIDVQARTMTLTHNDNVMTQDTSVMVVELSTTIDEMSDSVDEKVGE
jgi:hypothetical protein